MTNTTTNFEHFINRKHKELEEMQQAETQLTFDAECSLYGTRSASTRQPPSFHTMIDLMAKYIPLTSKAEIINEALHDSYVSFFSNLSEEDQLKVQTEYKEIFEVYCELKDKKKEG